MKKVILITLVTLSSVFTGFSQDKTSDIQKLFKLMDTNKMIDGMMDSMIPVMKQQASSQITGEDKKEKFNSYMDFIKVELAEMTKKLISNDMSGIYDTHFSHEEIKDLIVFYESSTGQKMIEKTPAITKDLMTSMMSNHMPKFQEKIKAKLEEFKKK